MSDYIINPSLFYWVNVVEKLACVCTIAAIVLGIASMAGTAIMMTNNALINEFPSICTSEKNTNAALKKLVPIGWILTAICLLALIFLPSKETLITMMVAKYATYENASLTVDALKSVVDYIIQAIQSVK